jgi:hypothetical protein
LIGNSDTTAKRFGWQVPVPIPDLGLLQQVWMPDFTLMRETPLASEWRFGVLRWSLASQNTWSMAVSIVPTAGFTAGFPFQGRSLAVAQAVPAVLWAGRNFPSSLHHHWRYQ